MPRISEPNLEFSALPKVFQDAISLTRTLGFRFLYIDFLCRSPDSRSNELEDALEKASIFQRSLLTIAATSATSDLANSGLFLPRKPPFKIQVTDSQGSASRIYVREQFPHYSFKQSAAGGDYELPFNTSEADSQAPLLRQAQGYVERLLSSRVLHFTATELIWECGESYTCECGQIDGLTFNPNTIYPIKHDFASLLAKLEAFDSVDNLAAKLSTTKLSNDANDSLTQRRSEALEVWSNIITEYTSKETSNNSNLLLGISGIAHTLTQHFQSSYIAGHWTYSTLNLLWHTTSPARHRSDSSIPSWSWASVSGAPVFFDNASAMDLACTASFPLDTSCSPKHTFSPIAGDILHITAAMSTEVTFHISANSASFSLHKNNISVDFTPDVFPLPDSADATPLKSGEKLVVVLASMTFASSILGFVLQRVKSIDPADQDQELYRRVGRFECVECRDDDGKEPEDAEALFEHWFPEIRDMSIVDEVERRTYRVL